jgi:hypothetical protein
MRTLALLCAFLVAACAGSFRRQAIAVTNTATTTIDAGTTALLAQYCAASMRAIGREGAQVADASRPAGVRCEARGPDATRTATPDESAALERVRAAWAPALDRAQAVVDAQRAVVRLARAGDEAHGGELVAALATLATAYEALREAARGAGIPAPPALSLGGVR